MTPKDGSDLRAAIEAAISMEPPYNDMPVSERGARLNRVERTISAAFSRPDEVGETNPTKTDRDWAEQFFPPSGWKDAAIDDLAQFLARFREAALATPPSDHIASPSGFDPSREYRIQCEACEGAGKIERRDIPLHHLHSEAPEYGTSACGECGGDGWRWTDKSCTLNACPPGCFVTMDGHLGFKSEYTTTLEDPRRYQCDAYCLESGEYFWGGAKSTEERGRILVRPVDAADLRESAL